ncbi:MAG: hypothetical protein Roseis2KO_09160 [Roseivirga sp.]
MTIDDGLITLAVSTISAVIVSLVTNSLNKRKTQAEIDLLKASREKTLVEIKNLAQNVEQEAQSGKRGHIYNGSLISESDFDFEQRKEWDAHLNKEVGENAKGICEIIEGVINVERLSNQGRFTLTLLKYLNNGNKISDRIEPSLTSDRERKIRLRCEVRSKESKEHLLRFVLKVKNHREDRWLSHADRPVIDSKWQPVNLIFRISPDEESVFKLDIYGSNSPSTVQIKKLVIEEDLY